MSKMNGSIDNVVVVRLVHVFQCIKKNDYKCCIKKLV